MSAPLEIESVGGFCPVQGYGTVCGRPFYFRARGEIVSFAVGRAGLTEPEGEASAVSGEEFYIADVCGFLWPAAGYLDEAQAREYIERGALVFQWLLEQEPSEQESLKGALLRAIRADDDARAEGVMERILELSQEAEAKLREAGLLSDYEDMDQRSDRRLQNAEAEMFLRDNTIAHLPGEEPKSDE